MSPELNDYGPNEEINNAYITEGKEQPNLKKWDFMLDRLDQKLAKKFAEPAINTSERENQDYYYQSIKVGDLFTYFINDKKMDVAKQCTETNSDGLITAFPDWHDFLVKIPKNSVNSAKEITISGEELDDDYENFLCSGINYKGVKIDEPIDLKKCEILMSKDIMEEIYYDEPTSQEAYYRKNALDDYIYSLDYDYRYEHDQDINIYEEEGRKIIESFFDWVATFRKVDFKKVKENLSGEWWNNWNI